VVIVKVVKMAIVFLILILAVGWSVVSVKFAKMEVVFLMLILAAE
jgi:hypothetical protein